MIGSGSLLMVALGLATTSIEEPARASLTLVHPLQVGTVSLMQLKRPSAARTSGSLGASVHADAPAVVRISGDPGRAYRIRVPRTVRDRDNAVVAEGVSIVSTNAGRMGHDGGMAQMDGQGRDVLRISARYTASGIVPGRLSAIPLAIDYE